MKKIFITGPIGCGKSTLIKNVLGDNLNYAGGFITKRVIEHDKLIGFDIVSLGLGKDNKHVRFLTFKEGKTVKNNEAFSIFASNLLKDATTKPFAVIDEIGGFEILIPEFMEAFDLFLKSQVPCVGVLKSLPSAEKLLKTTNLHPDFLKATKQFHLNLLSDSDIKIIEINNYKDKNALNILKKWKEKYIEHGEIQ